MSQENVEAVRGWATAMSAGRPDALEDAAEEHWEVDADFYPARKIPEALPCHGRQEITRFYRTYLEAWGQFEVEVKDVFPVGDDRVLARVSLKGTGQGSGALLEGDVFQSFWLRHGRFLRVEDHLTLKGALHALGLHGESFETAGLRD